MTTTKILARTLGAVALTMSALAVTSPAQAGAGDWGSTNNYWLDTKAQCNQVQREYTTPNTRITKPCHANGQYWVFTWQTRL